ncbi:MAG: PD-(D/E)XK nuclease family protein [Ignavibacteria bacterium]
MALWVTSRSDSTFRALLECGDLANGLRNISESSIVIVPTRRQKETVLRAWALNHGTGEPPMIETMAAFVHRLGEHLLSGVPTILAENEVDVLIRQVIADSSMLTSIGFESQKLVRWTQYGITPDRVDELADLAHAQSRKGRILAEIAAAWRKLIVLYSGLACDRGRYELEVLARLPTLAERPLRTPSGDEVRSCVMIATHGVTTLDRDVLAALAACGWDVGVGFADDLPSSSGTLDRLGVSVADAAWFGAQGWTHGEDVRSIPSYATFRVALPSREEEVRRTIASIKDDVRHGVSLRDIAICVPGASVYRQIIEDLARRSDLPLEAASSIPLSAEPEATALRAACDVALRGWMREDVERLLSHKKITQTINNASDIIAVARQERITGGEGPAKWLQRIDVALQRLAEQAGEMDDESPEASSLHFQRKRAERALACMNDLAARLPTISAHALRAADFAEALRRAVDAMGLASTRASSVPATDRLLECLDVYTSLAERHQLSHLMFDEHVVNWWSLVQAVGPSTTFTSGSGAAVVSPAELRCRSWKRVYVLGMVEGEFPRLQEHVADREIIPDVLERMYVQALTDIVWSVAEGGRLVFTRPAKIDGAATLASSLLDALPVVVSAEPPALLSASTRVAVSKRDVRKCAGERYRLDQTIHIGSILDEKLASVVQEELQRPVSASRLDVFSQCSYRYYAERILRLKSIDISDMRLSPLERGTMLHEVVAEFFKQQQPQQDYESTSSILDVKQLMIRLDPARTDQYWSTLQSIAHQCMRTREWTHAYAQIEQDMLFGTALRPGLLRQWLQQEIAYQSTTKHYPAFLELDLDVQIHVPGEHSSEVLSIRGRIDRIDVSDSGEQMTFIVNDYKPAVEGKYRLQEIMSGTLSQMPIYLEAARVWLANHNVDAEPWAALYRSFGNSIHNTDEPQNRVAMKDPSFVITKADPGIKQPDWRTTAREFALKPLAEQNAEVLSVIGGIARNMQSGEFAVKPLQKACQTCDYHELCRVDEWGKG